MPLTGPSAAILTCARMRLFPWFWNQKTYVWSSLRTFTPWQEASRLIPDPNFHPCHGHQKYLLTQRRCNPHKKNTLEPWQPKRNTKVSFHLIMLSASELDGTLRKQMSVSEMWGRGSILASPFLMSLAIGWAHGLMPPELWLRGYLQKAMFRMEICYKKISISAIAVVYGSNNSSW